ncbi:MAG: ROK family protein, partial [Candidatus Omnitrophica bacterium]|nr:ROK family protein [Candidatus Omnitrophota bacterium]
MKRYIIGVDIGGTNTKVALLDFGGHILHKKDFLTKSYGSDRLLDGVAKESSVILKDKSIKKTELLGLGIGLPGLVDFKRGLVFSLTNIPRWKDV